MRYGRSRYRLRILAALLAAVLSLLPALAEEADDEEGNWLLPEILEASGGTAVYTTNDRGVEFIWGTLSDETVSSFDEADGVIGRLLPMLGSDSWTQLEPDYELEDDNGYHYYVYRQWADSVAVSYGIVKLIVDPSGRPVGLNGYVVPADSIDYEPTVDEEEARNIVLEVISADPLYAGQIQLTGDTGLTVIDIDDPNQGSTVPALCYIVYTTNLPDNLEFPYLAHYVTASGGWYSHVTPCTLPNDELAMAASDASVFFDDYEPDTLEACLQLRDGSRRNVTLDIAVDPEGKRCLVDTARRIVIARADAYDEDGNLQILPVTEWEEADLFMLDAVKECYDYYAAVGWTGADGLGTPILVLNDCLDQGEPVSNAAYVSEVDGWQLFSIGRADGIPQCQDIIGHEYTHCVTAASMSDIIYMNEQGAINEGLSDVMGNIMEMLLGRTDDVNWMIGESSGELIRCMSSPELFEQPSFVGGEYYVPGVTVPQASLNDMGGVHVNSSLVNLTAVRLWQAGMSLEELRILYTTLICMMIPSNGFLEFARMLPIAMSMCDLSAWTGRAAAIVSEIGLDTDGRTLLRLEPGCGKLTFTLPEIPGIATGAWILQISSTPDDGAGLLGQFRSQMEDSDWTLFPEAETEAEDGEAEFDFDVFVQEETVTVHPGGKSYYTWPDRNTGTITLTALEGDYMAMLLNTTDTDILVLTWDGRQWTNDLYANQAVAIRSGQLTSLNTVGIADSAAAIMAGNGEDAEDGAGSEDDDAA